LPRRLFGFVVHHVVNPTTMTIMLSQKGDGADEDGSDDAPAALLVSWR
jgi:hypothetical protein